MKTDREVYQAAVDLYNAMLKGALTYEEVRLRVRVLAQINRALSNRIEIAKMSGVEQDVLKDGVSI